MTDAYMIRTLERIFSRVNKRPKGGCWQWSGTVNSNGYGSIWFRGKRMKLVHRILYQHVTGLTLPSNVLCLHKCDNTRCVNPDHLFLGSTEDNFADMRRKGRNARGEQIGRNKLTGAQVEEIKRNYRREGYRKSNAKELAAKYGVGRGAITSIISGRYWDHVTGLPRRLGGTTK